MVVARRILWLAVFTLFKVVQGSIFDQTSKSRCQPIDIPACKDIPYNLTIFPNPNFQYDQENLQSQVEHFKPLFKTRCHPHIKFFVCSVFAPMCPESMPQAVTSCRSVCEEVKRDCIKVLEEVDLPWPSPLNCSNFPEESKTQLCMNPEKPHDTPPTEYNSFVRIPETKENERFEFSRVMPICPPDLIDLDPTDLNATCAFRCHHDTMFTKENKNIAKYWLLLWASMNIVVTLFTVFSFLIDRHRFRFPERSIFYVALCYLVYSIPFLERLFLSYEQSACWHLPGGRAFLVHSSLDNKLCVISFLLNYYFSMAGNLWWLMLTFTWYLSAARKWVQEEIEKRSSYLHLVSWGLPGIFTIFALITQKVDASELTGICSIGNTDPYALGIFVILPRIFVLVIGSCFIVAGFFWAIRERDCFRQRGTDTSKLEKLMFKMGAFSTLYVIPAVVMAICECYHFFVLYNQWYSSAFACKQNGGADRCRRPSRPTFEIYMLNFTMSLFIGLATGLWIFSWKTMKSWRDFLCCGQCQAPSTQKLSPASTLPHQHTLDAAQSRPLIPPARNPPPIPSQSHYMPLSVMTSQGGTVPANSYADSWKPSKII